MTRWIPHDGPSSLSTRLPADVLEVVFEFVDDPQLLATCRLVGAKWRDAVRGMLRFVSGRDDTWVVYGRGAVACRVGLERAQQWSRLCIVAFAATLEAIVFPRELCPPPLDTPISRWNQVATELRVAASRRQDAEVAHILGTAHQQKSRGADDGSVVHGRGPCVSLTKLRSVRIGTIADHHGPISSGPVTTLVQFLASVLANAVDPARHLNELQLCGSAEFVKVVSSRALSCPLQLTVLHVESPPRAWLVNLAQRSPGLTHLTWLRAGHDAFVMSAAQRNTLARLTHLRSLTLALEGGSMNATDVWEIFAKFPASLEEATVSVPHMVGNAGVDSAGWPAEPHGLTSLELRLPTTAEAPTVGPTRRGPVVVARSLDHRRDLLEGLLGKFRRLERLRVYTAAGVPLPFTRGPVELVDHPTLRHVTLEKGGGFMVAFNAAAADRRRLPCLAAVDVVAPSGGLFPPGLAAMPDVVAVIDSVADDATFDDQPQMRRFFDCATALWSLSIPHQRLSLQVMDVFGRTCFARLKSLDVAVSSEIKTAEDYTEFFRAMPNMRQLSLALPFDNVLGSFMEALRSHVAVAAIPAELEVLRITLPRNTRSGVYVPRASLLDLVTAAIPASASELHVHALAHPEEEELLKAPEPWPSAALRLFCDAKLIDPASRTELVRRGVVDLDAFYPV